MIATDPARSQDASSADDGGTLALWEWRRRVAALYAAVREEPVPALAWRRWRETRDAMFATHPQSPIEASDRAAFTDLAFFDYDPALRLTVGIDPAAAEPVPFAGGGDGTITMRPFGRTRGLADRLGGELTLFWIAGYGGGVFLPFADATSGQETYGAGRYLLDTIKSADLGATSDGATILDFNFAYNPSCVYSPRYVCPLAPRENRLPQPVRAGEKAPPL